MVAKKKGEGPALPGTEGLEPTPLPQILRHFAARFLAASTLARTVTSLRADGAVVATREQNIAIQETILAARRAIDYFETVLAAIAYQHGVASERAAALDDLIEKVRRAVADEPDARVADLLAALEKGRTGG